MKKEKEFKKQALHIMNFFDNFKEIIAFREIKMVALRPKLTSTLASNFQGDFDFMLDKKEFPKVFKIIYDLCKTRGVNFILSQKKENKKRFCFFIKGSKDISLIVEFWTAIEYTDRGKINCFPVKKIMKSIQDKEITKIEALVFIYITHLHHKKKDVFSEENKYRFNVFLEELAKDGLLLKVENAKGLLKEIQNKRLNIQQANTKALYALRKVGIKSKPTIYLKINRLSTKIQNKFVRVDQLIPVLGPDGSGKGVISETAIASFDRKKILPFRFKKLFRVKKIYSLRLSLFADRSKRQKNEMDEKLGYYIFFMSFFSLLFLLIKYRNRTILMDRYFIDYFGTPIRYSNKDNPPRRIQLYKFLLWLTPKPKRMVFLGCRYSSLVERKNELSVEAVDFLQNVYIEFILKKRVSEVLFLSSENEITISSENLRVFLQKQ